MQKIVEHGDYKYKTYKKIPDADELTSYYTKKYFKNNKNYAYQKDPVEIEYERAETEFLLDVLTHFYEQSLSSVVEVGSGEGFFLANALKRELDCRGFDYSIDQLLDEHAFCKDAFNVSNDPIASVCELSIPLSCIVLRHVIEHVPDPVSTVRDLSSILDKGSLLVIEAPHDFKPLQLKLVKEGFSLEEYWLCYPDHLSYFSPAQLSDLLTDNGFVVRECYGDHPIELMLLSEKFNYQLNKGVGKSVHHLRCAISSYLYKNTPLNELLALRRAYCNCEIGRSFTVIAERV